jgi:hypothetical protein
VYGVIIDYSVGGWVIVTVSGVSAIIKGYNKGAWVTPYGVSAETKGICTYP